MKFTCIELPPFERVRAVYLSDDDFAFLQDFLCEQPDAGDVIPGSGGCRKLRWARPGMGKRGGLRIVYYVRLASGRVLLLTLYSKNVRDNIQPGTLRKILETAT